MKNYCLGAIMASCWIVIYQLDQIVALLRDILDETN